MQARAPSITKANIPSGIAVLREQAVLCEQVAKLFRASYQRGPWPKADQCYDLAIMICTIRNSKSYRKDFERHNRTLRRRRAIIEATKQLIKEQQKSVNDQLAVLRLPGPLQHARALAALEAALEQATPALLQPFDPLAGQRDKAWWHKAARMIAERTQNVLIQAKNKKLSRHKHGAFVKVVAGALKLAIGKDFDLATIANVLTTTSK